MRRTILIAALILLTVAGFGARQRFAGLKIGVSNDNKHDGQVIVVLNDGTRHQGWNRTDMLPLMAYVEISENQKSGKKQRFASDDIERLIFIPNENPKIITPPDTTEFVKFPAIAGAIQDDDGSRNYFWFRHEYSGRGIELYSFYNEEQRVSNDGFTDFFTRDYYVKIGDGPLALCSVANVEEEVKSEQASNRAYAVRAFEAYPELIEKINQKGFKWDGSPLPVIKEWELLYTK